MGKRAFERRGKGLRDTYAERGQLYIREIGPLPGPPEVDAHDAAGVGATADVLGRLLLALEAGDVRAPQALLAFIADIRVSTALLKAAREASPALLANVAQVLGSAGVNGAADVLGKRLDELAVDTRVFEDATPFNHFAGSLTAVAAALLRLQPENTRAANALVRLLSHPSAFERRTAAAAASDALELPLPEGVAGQLESELHQLLASADTQLFAAIAPAVARKEPKVILSRCGTLLQSTDPAARETGIGVLRRLDEPKASEMLVAHLAHESDLRLACAIAGHLGPKAPEAMRLALARRALADDSPSLRFEGLTLLASLSAGASREVAHDVLPSEPDPFLRSRLESFARSSP
ncbi:MAG TPA: hypothetical protein VJO34_17780 [Methylomirabilota bacterium]|nr:hypothetical protein [Methylomirabilota bacterium]